MLGFAELARNNDGHWLFDISTGTFLRDRLIYQYEWLRGFDRPLIAAPILLEEFLATSLEYPNEEPMFADLWKIVDLRVGE